MIAAPRFGASFGAEWVAVCTALCFRDPVRAALCLWLNWPARQQRIDASTRHQRSLFQMGLRGTVKVNN